MLFSAEASRYWIWYRNSILLTLIQVPLTLLISACVAYGFVGYEFCGCCVRPDELTAFRNMASFAAMAILNGMTSWNNFLWPLLALRSEEKYTLPIGLNTLITPYGNNYDLLIVGSFFAIFPIVMLFLFFQKYFIEGMTAGAVKG